MECRPLVGAQSLRGWLDQDHHHLHLIRAFPQARVIIVGPSRTTRAARPQAIILHLAFAGYPWAGSDASGLAPKLGNLRSYVGGRDGVRCQAGLNEALLTYVWVPAEESVRAGEGLVVFELATWKLAGRRG